jgi:hypothetical protein
MLLFVRQKGDFAVKIKVKKDQYAGKTFPGVLVFFHLFRRM